MPQPKKVTELNAEKLRELFNYDSETGVITWQKSGKGRRRDLVAGAVLKTESGKQYRQIMIAGKAVFAHRVAWCMHHGSVPGNMQIDHINGDGLDNRITNLRLATNAENSRNQRMRSTNTSGRVGVRFRKHNKKWIAQGHQNSGYKYLGHFETFDEACAARDEWELSSGYDPGHGSDRSL